MTNRLPPAQIVLTAFLTAAASRLWGEVFLWNEVAGAVILAGLVPVVLAVGLRLATKRPHAALAIGLQIVAVVVFIAVFIAATDPFSTLVDGVVNGWATILSIQVPVPDRPELVVVPVAMTWFASAVAIEILLRTRARLGVEAPSVVLAIMASLFGDGVSTVGVGAISLYAGAAVTLLALRSQYFTTDPVPADSRTASATDDPELAAAVRRQRVVALVPAALAVVILGAGVAIALPLDTGDQSTLRDDRQLPVDDFQQPNPLVEVDAASAEDPLVLRVRVDEATSGPLRLRTQVLNNYDGVTWTSDGEFVPIGGQVPDESVAVHDSSLVAQHFQLIEFDDPFLPALDRPLEVTMPDGLPVGADPLTGVLVAPNHDAALTYTVQSRVPTVDVTTLPTAGVAVGPEARAAVSGSLDLPPSLTDLSNEIRGSAASPFEQVARLLAYFTDPEGGPRRLGPAFQLDPEKPAGFSVAELDHFLTAEVEGQHVGTETQVVVAFATLAQAQGLPSRLAVGYVIDEPEAGRDLDVHQSQRAIWPEIGFAGAGWVAFDPIPRETDEAVAPEEEAMEATIEQTNNQSTDQAQDRPPENPNLGVEEAATDDDSPLPKLLLVLAALAIVPLLVLLPVIRKRRRARKRRSAPDPADRIDGAWNEALDRLVEVGLDDAECLSTLRAVEAGRTCSGEEVASDLARLGGIVDQSRHAAQEPSEVDAQAAWELSDRVGSGVRSRLDRRARTRASLSRRPLVSPRH